MKNPFNFFEQPIIKNLVTNKYLMIVSGDMAVQMTAFMGRIAVTAYWVIYCLGSFTLISLIMTAFGYVANARQTPEAPRMSSRGRPALWCRADRGMEVIMKRRL